jgi:hypothetical protein
MRLHMALSIDDCSGSRSERGTTVRNGAQRLGIGAAAVGEETERWRVVSVLEASAGTSGPRPDKLWQVAL